MASPDCPGFRVSYAWSRCGKRTYPKRETFAYACEAFARVLEHARRPSDRLELADAFGRQFRPGDERVDADEVADIVRDAAGRRNGWKVILGPQGSPFDRCCSR